LKIRKNIPRRDTSQIIEVSTFHNQGRLNNGLQITVIYAKPWVFSITAKIPEISVGIQMDKSVSVSSDWNIRDHLWRWSTYFGRNIPIEIRRSTFDKLVWFFALIRGSGKVLNMAKDIPIGWPGLIRKCRSILFGYSH